MVICVPGPEPGTGRVRAREGLGGSEGTDQGGSRALSPLGCGPGGLRGEEGVSPLPPPESPAAGGRGTGAGTGVGLGSPSPGAARPAALPPVSLPSGFHGAGRRLPRRPTARTSQSAWSCGSSSPPGWRQGVGGAGGRAPGLRRRLPQSAQAPAARVLATVPAPAPAPASSRLRGDAPWGRAPPVKDGDAAGKAGPRGAEGGRSLGPGEGGRLHPHPAPPPSTALRSARSARARSLGAPAGGAPLTSSADPHPPAEGRWPRRLALTDTRTDRARREGRAVRPCPGKLPAPSCCCRRRAGPGPAQVRSRSCVRLGRPPPLPACPSPSFSSEPPPRPLPGPFGVLPFRAPES